MISAFYSILLASPFLEPSLLLSKFNDFNILLDVARVASFLKLSFLLNKINDFNIVLHFARVASFLKPSLLQNKNNDFNILRDLARSASFLKPSILLNKIKDFNFLASRLLWLSSESPRLQDTPQLKQTKAQKDLTTNGLRGWSGGMRGAIESAQGPCPTRRVKLKTRDIQKL